MKKEHKILVAIALIYIGLILLFISKFEFNPSATIELSEAHLGRYNGNVPGGIVVHKTDGFDGQFYYMMTLNPTLEKLRVPPSFLQRILYPILVKILSLNYTPLFPVVFILINLSAVLISSYALLILLKKYNANLNLVYLWAFNVGFLISTTRNLTEPLMVCLIVLMVYFFEEKKHFYATLFLALALLTKEIAITVYAAMLLYFLIKKNLKNFIIYGLSIIPFATWEVFLAFKTGAIPLVLSSYLISNLPIGFLNYFNNFFSNCNTYIIKPLKMPLDAFNIYDYLQKINAAFSPLPILLFVAIQFLIMVIFFIKEKKITKYTLLPLSQIALIFLLQKNLFFEHEIDAVGRYALPLFFFSMIYFAEREKKYNKILAGLIILSSGLYFIQRFILPKGEFWITFG